MSDEIAQFGLQLHDYENRQNAFKPWPIYAQHVRRKRNEITLNT